MIDGGLRPARPSGRQVAYRHEPAYHHPEESYRSEPAAPAEAPRQSQTRRAAEESIESAPRRQRSLGWVKWLVGVLLIVVIGVAGWMFWPYQKSIATTIDTSKYQAVFLSNGQVYFGKLSVVNNDFMELANVYYLERQLTASTDTDTEVETDVNKQPTSNDNNFQLLKYSDVLYGSEDAMIISRDDIIRFENLRTDGVVAKAIANRR